MTLKKLRDLLEWPVMILFVVAVVTAALDKSILGFSPILWLLLSFWFLLLIICMEVSMIREHLEKEKEE